MATWPRPPVTPTSRCGPRAGSCSRRRAKRATRGGPPYAPSTAVMRWWWRMRSTASSTREIPPRGDTGWAAVTRSGTTRATGLDWCRNPHLSCGRLPSSGSASRRAHRSRLIDRAASRVRIARPPCTLFTMPRSNPSPARRGRKPKPRALDLRITIAGIEPPIWRLVRVPDAYTLHQLHRVIQLVFGWLDYHLYAFTVGGRRFEEPLEEAED